MIANRVLICNSDTSTAAAIGPKNMAEPNAPKKPARIKANIPATVNINIRLNEIFISFLSSMAPVHKYNRFSSYSTDNIEITSENSNG